ncbi:MAG: hypothetical protein ABH859_01720 [Pseudomonadota bacterium]
MKPFNYWHLLIIFILTIYFTPSYAAQPGVEINRNILAVIDRDEIQEDFDNHIYTWAAMPLNHLGYKITYVDVSKRLPTDQEMQQFPVILSWFTDNKLRGASEYAKWLTKQLRGGKKAIILGDFGFDYDENMVHLKQELLDDFYNAFGISFSPDQTTQSPLLIEVAYKDPNMMDFERQLSTDLTHFEDIKVKDKQSNIYLKLKRKDTGTSADAVFIHNKGAYVLTDYATYLNPINYQASWYINPFKFFEAALKTNFPRPDYTTVSGMRIFYNQIDGDGIRNVTLIDKKTPSGEMLYKEVFTKYELPITASVVIGDILLAANQERHELMRFLKKLFMLPNIEPASHGWAHPYEWIKGDKSDMALRTEGYVYTPQAEIGDAVAYMNKYLVPKNKKVDLFLWTGDCEPDYEALKYTYDHNIKELNGGDTRFDDNYPSYTNVSPLFRPVGNLRQHLTAGSNEILYTNEWEGPFYGLKYVINTFERTNKPRRVAPINVYYHFYIGEHQVAIDSLYLIYDWVLKQEFSPLFTSEYYDIQEGFLSTRINKISANQWIIYDNKALRTFRLDDYKGYVDLAKSKGVAGFNVHENALYVHLDNGEQSQIVLTSTKPNQIYLIKANGLIRNWQGSASKAGFELRTMGIVQFSLGALKPNQEYNLLVKNKKFKTKTNEKGELNFLNPDLLSNAFEWIQISLI